MNKQDRARQFLTFLAESFPDKGVALIQEALKARGLYPIEVDGDPGSVAGGKTWAGFKEFAGTLTPKEEAGAALTLPPSRFPEQQFDSPNCRDGNQKLGLVLHHTSGYFAGDLDWCMKTKAQGGGGVSYHVIIHPNGSRAILCDDDKAAYHAGDSNWHGRRWCNGFMLGLGFSGADGKIGDTYQFPLTIPQIASAIEWILPRYKAYGWRLSKRDVTDHRQVSPGRKNDLNPTEFNRFMVRLAEAIEENGLPL